MCKVLNISKSSYYYIINKPEAVRDESELIEKAKQIFHSSRRTYGTRRIKKELSKLGDRVSRRRIARIMREHGLVSKYTVAKFKPIRTKVNEDKIDNTLNREFNDREYRQVVVSDLTYVRVGMTWHYICILLDLHNREIIGYSASRHKDAQLVKEAFNSVSGSLKRIQLFHTDRGSEFKNQVIDEILKAFNINRSLSRKGTPHDNAAAEAGFKTIKTEFVNGEHFETIDELRLELFDYVNWYNNHRIHSSLGYLTPVAFRKNNL